MSISKLLFGEIALKKTLVTKDQVDECLEIQKKLKEMGITRTLGAVMHDKKYLSMVEIKEILREMTGTKDWNAIEGYEILGKLGKGGMGAVYKARHQKLNRIVALKVLPPELAADQEYLNRFMREAQAAAKLNHVNIVQALDVGESYGYHYFVMEYAEGKTVKDLIESQGVIPEETSLDIIEQIAQALEHASRNDLVHRDIKPSNIIVSSDGVAKLLDLGLAKSISEDQTITQTGVIMGTPFYLSPEQARSEELDPRSDLYSLGVTMFHMLTGQVPFNGNSAATILYKHIFQDPPKVKSLNPKVSPDTSALVWKMMAKTRDERHASPDDLCLTIHALREKLGYSIKSKSGNVGVGGTSASGRLTDSADAALDNTLADSQSEAPPKDVETVDEKTLGLGISGPQQKSPSQTSRTEPNTSPEARRRRDELVAEAAGRGARRPSALKPRALLAFGSGALAAGIAVLVAANVLHVPQRAPLSLAPGGVAEAALAHQAPSPAVGEGLHAVEALRAQNKLREAMDTLASLGTDAGRRGKALEAADEVALERARAGLVEAVKKRADELNADYDRAIAKGEDTDAIVASIKGLEVPSLVRLVEADRVRLEDEKKANAEGK